jgi:hypothetical protein
LIGELYRPERQWGSLSRLDDVAGAQAQAKKIADQNFSSDAEEISLGQVGEQRL